MIKVRTFEAVVQIGNKHRFSDFDAWTIVVARREDRRTLLIAQGLNTSFSHAIYRIHRFNEWTH